MNNSGLCRDTIEAAISKLQPRPDGASVNDMASSLAGGVLPLSTAAEVAPRDNSHRAPQGRCVSVEVKDKMHAAWTEG